VPHSQALLRKQCVEGPKFSPNFAVPFDRIGGLWLVGLELRPTFCSSRLAVSRCGYSGDSLVQVVLIGLFQHRAQCPFPCLFGISFQPVNSSILSKNRASGKVGAVHCLLV
jgi:hypothetical protein